jgi:hypothetical protein
MIHEFIEKIIIHAKENQAFHTKRAAERQPLVVIVLLRRV